MGPSADARRFVLQAAIPANTDVIEVSARTVAYGVPESAWLRREVARYGGILDHLRYVAERVEKDCDWSNGFGALFILTGYTPRIPRIRYVVHGEIGRIELHIDTATVPPHHVARYYKEILTSLRPGFRARAISEKHLQLAVFAASRPDDSWGTRFEA